MSGAVLLLIVSILDSAFRDEWPRAVFAVGWVFGYGLLVSGFFLVMADRKQGRKLEVKGSEEPSRRDP